MSRDKGTPRSLNSAVVILQALDCEGFSDYVGSLIKRYWRRNIMTPHKAKRVDALKAAFSQMVKDKLDEGDRQILGRMMALHSKQSFDTGVRIGMGARVVLTNGIDIEDLYEAPQAPATQQQHRGTHGCHESSRTELTARLTRFDD